MRCDLVRIGGVWMRSLRKSSAVVPYLVGGLSAAVAAGLGMALVRWALLVRTIPERVMEWLLLFVPVDVFEAGVIRFGFDAKRYALYASIAVTLALLAALGTYALRRRWSMGAIGATG